MATDFEAEDKYSWYFGPLSREEANDILQDSNSGVFLVRDSQSIRGDFVLCVKEDGKLSHYIINRIVVGGMTRFKIGDNDFNDIPSLLNFYKSHYLDTTPLIRPAPREKLVAKYDFHGKDPEDLPFKKGEILEVITKDEDEWWTARNSQGRVGQIPVNYVTKANQANGTVTPKPDEKVYIDPRNQPPQLPGLMKGIKVPARARVIQDRIPSMYDKTQLRLKKGDIITVLSTNVNGFWEGEVNGRRGIFPFTHIQFINEDQASSP